MSRRFRLKAQVVEAFRLNASGPTPTPDWACEALRNGRLISVPGGMMVVQNGSREFAALDCWIVKREDGSLFPCDNDRFVARFEEI